LHSNGLLTRNVYNPHNNNLTSVIGVLPGGNSVHIVITVGMRFIGNAVGNTSDVIMVVITVTHIVNQITTSADFNRG
jgi:hypothetical protein